MLLVVSVVVPLRVATGAPADIFSSPAPALTADAPKASEVGASDLTVSTQTGALSWSYPIAVPPGRNGVRPSVSLAYSSSSPVYGGIAAGFAWNLGVPDIHEDTSESRIKTHSPLVELAQAEPQADDRFVGLNGRRLVPVSELKAADVYKTYRASGDDGFQLYERIAMGAQPYWRVRSLDGSVLEFGGASAVCSNVREGNAPLTRSVDGFGNEISYTYEEVVPGECRLKSIAWGANANAGLVNFAAINFVWSNPPPTCDGVPVGLQMDYRTGTKIVTGASHLTALSVIAFEPIRFGPTVHTRTIALQYSSAHMQCNRQHAPVKLLTSIQETVTGNGIPTVALPQVTLEYSDPAVAFANPGTSGPRPWAAIHPSFTANTNNLAWGYRYATESTRQIDRTPTVEEMMVDLDGDSLPDRLVNTSSETFNGNCSATWQRNLGPAPGGTEPTFAPATSIALPRLKWHGQLSNPPPVAGGTRAEPSRGEKCSLAGQVTAFWNSWGPSVCHNGTDCRVATDPNDLTYYCSPNGGECPSATDDPASFTYLHYRWVDADGDGLTDLVAAVHGDVRTYDIEQGNAPIFTTPPPEPLLFGPWPTCPQNVDRCKNVDPSCVSASKGNVSAINACINSAPTIPCNELIDAPQAAPQSINRGPYQRCEGLYPWFIFKNTGNGQFASPVIKYQPVPLESDRGDSSFGPARGWSSQQHAILDFDGDGILDAVAKPDPQWGSFWWVWFGDGTGGFEPKRHMFFARPDGLIAQSGTVPLASIGATEGLLDINADGLPDHWKFDPTQTNASVWFNTGIEHLYSTAIATPFGVKPGDDAQHEFGPNDVTYIAPHPPADPSPRWTYWAGTTKQQNRVYDVDQDGRVDVVSPSPIEGPPSVVFNLGSQFNTARVSLVSNPQGLRRITNVVGQNSVPEGTWYLLSDHLDLDGDGIAEVVDFTSGSYTRARQLNAVPPRRLTKVHNGRGAHTTIAYASMQDKTTVEQNPSSFWTDHWNRQRPNASPETQWVVKSLTTTDDFSSTSSTTNYFYKHPRHGADDKGKYSFRGFEEVTTTAPSGSKSIERYGYDVDWSGRSVETLVKPSANEMTVAEEVRSITRVTWEERSLFAGALRTAHATVTEQFTCWNGQTEAACKTPSGAAAYTRKTATLRALRANGAPEASIWVATSSLLQAGTSGAPGDRTTDTAFVFESRPGLYVMRPLRTEKRVSNGTVMLLYEKTATAWDPDYRVKLSEEVWFDDTRSAVTRYEYDLTTGNLTKRWKPKQYATNKFTQYTYDSRQLFIATEVNEVGHRVDHTYEYGTGTKLMTEGPNARTCVTSSTCPLDATHPLKEQHKVVIDALGRTIETWDTVSDDGTLYTLTQRSTTSYVDLPPPPLPTSITTRVRLDTTSSVWTQETTEVDGHGRPIKKTSFAQGSAPADHVTVYSYRNDGTLATIQLPDPSQNNAARVTYSYFFDSLGRPTMLRRPDGADPMLDQSGINIRYDGTITTTQSVTPSGTGGGESVTSVAKEDAFGRVVETEEIDPTLPPHPTTYGYGPDDSVTSIIAPDGVTTTMKHDFAGHRTELTRHGRTWKYGYDDNGNLVSVMVPGSPNPPVTDINFTTTTIYDDLDRPLEKLIGQRTLSAADQALFATRKETYEYDVGGNMLGQLRYWRTFAPNQSSAAITHSTRVNNQHQLINAIQTLRIAGFPALQRNFELRYLLSGGVSEVRFQDTLGGTSKTTATAAYDARGLPKSMVLKRTGQADQTLAVQTRNVAGLVTKRRTDTTGAMTFVESNWAYDKLGRVAIQSVQKGPGPVQVAREVVRYFGNDNPQTLTGGTGTSQLTFTYDARNQLKTVSSSTAGYFSATYDYGAGGRFKRATEAQTISPLPAGTDVKPRNVDYVYGDADPERLTALKNVSNGSTYAGYTYDAVGNVTKRCYGGSGVPSCTGESIDYVYDGKDQLRRATKKINGVVQGSEEYWYGGSGERIAIVKRNATGTKTEMIWFIGDVQAHYDGAGNATHIYSHLSLGTPIARVDRTSNTATSLEYQFHGLANNTIAAVAQDGTINATFRYAPFGEVIEATNAGGASAGTATHNRRLNDKYQDDLTALAYYGARYYDKTSMTWTQSDPLYRFVPDLAQTSSSRRANLYQFSLNNPLRYMDPDGRDSGHWTRGSQNTLDFAMKRQNKGAIYGGGWMPDSPSAPALECGAMAPGECEAVAKGETQWTFQETLAMAYPGATITLTNGEKSTAVADPTAVTASDELFPEVERSCEPNDNRVGEPPYASEPSPPSVTWTRGPNWVNPPPSHSPDGVSAKIGVGYVVTKIPYVKWVAHAYTGYKLIRGMYKMLTEPSPREDWIVRHNNAPVVSFKVLKAIQNYSPTYDMKRLPPVFMKTWEESGR